MGGEGQPVYARVPGRCRTAEDKGQLRGSEGQPREMQGQGCQSAGGYNKGPGVERPRGQGLCIWLLCYSPPPALVVGEGGVVGLVVGAFVVACVICSVVFSTTELAVVSSAESPVLVRDVLE